MAGKKIPFTPDYSALVGTQVTHAINARVTMYGRAEAVFYGAFHYDDLNTATQDAYCDRQPAHRRQEQMDLRRGVGQERR